MPGIARSTEGTLVEILKETLRRLAGHGDLHLRAPKGVARAWAGLTRLDTYGPIRRLWDEARQNHKCWLSTAVPFCSLPWADRAQALATRACREQATFGIAGPLWAHLPTVTAPNQDMCCVCLEDFDDVWPAPNTPQTRYPNAPGLFACDHAMCAGCDRQIQSRNDSRCPLCRAPRVHWTGVRP